MKLIRSSVKGCLIIFAIFSVLGGSFANLISVCPDGCDHHTLTAAVNAAREGDTIEVQSGTYRENVDVLKPIILRGIDTGKGTPVIDAARNGSAIEISAEGVIVDGFEVRGALGSWFDVWAGIEVTSGNNTIMNNLAIDNENGIMLTSSGNKPPSNNRVVGNNATHNLCGINLQGSNNNFIKNNNLTLNNRGILLTDSNMNKITSIQAASNNIGMQLKSSSDNVLRDNLLHSNKYNFEAEGPNDIDTSNLIDFSPIYYLVGASDEVISKDSNVGAVYCIDCVNVTVVNLELSRGVHGIYLYNITSSLIADNNLNANLYGILLMNSSGNVLVGNDANGNGIDGILISSCWNNTLESNTALNNTVAGLNISRSDYNIIDSNRAFGNGQGIMLHFSSHNKLSRNRLNDSQIGIQLMQSWMNALFNNTISGSHDTNLLLESSKRNHIFRNEIYNGSIGISFNPLENNIFENNKLLENEINWEELSGTTAGVGPKFPVEFSSVPSRAEIIIDNQFFDITNETKYFNRDEWGNHTVRMKLGNVTKVQGFNVPKIKKIEKIFQ
jgi:parallel beta-helix repeat protein